MVKSALRLKDAQDRSDILNRELLTVNAELEQALEARDGELIHARNGLVLALTAGGLGPWYTPEGINGTLETNFYPVHHGVFWYCGMTVLEPFAAYGAGRADEDQRAAYLKAWTDRLESLDGARVVYPAKI